MRPKEAAEASTGYQLWQQHTNDLPEDTPLVNKPKWWATPRGAQCIEKAPAKRKWDAVAPSLAPQSSSGQTEPAPSISASILSRKLANDPLRNMARGLSESIHASTSHMQSHTQPDLTQVRINQHNSMEVNFLSNPNHPDGWGGSPIISHMFQGDRQRLKIKCCIKGGLYTPPRVSLDSLYTKYTLVGVQWDCTRTFSPLSGNEIGS